MALWLLILLGWLPGVTTASATLWHGHELIFGFATASTIGFVLTALPEFTRTPPPSRQTLLRLALLWLAARVSYPLAFGLFPAVGVWPAAPCNLALWIWLLLDVVPRVAGDPERQHLSFAWVLGALMLLQMGFFISLSLNLNALAWLRATVGAFMVLIVIAASRISMRVVNRLIEVGRPGDPAPGDIGYLARPPRRNLAIFTICLYSATEFALGQDAVTGWTALAAAAAMLNLLNDWHVGRALFTRWALMMYAFYWLIAIGYALLGAAALGAPLQPSAGRHLLMAGAMGLSVFTVMTVVGRIHAGLWLDRRRWVPVTASALVLAALLRAAASVNAAAPWALRLLILSGALWAACFAAYLLISWSTLAGARADGLSGCAGPADRGASSDDPTAC